MRLAIRNLTKLIDKVAVLDKISFSFEAGLIYGLTGAKHSGKTLLFRCIAREESFDKGKIRINRDNVDEKIGYMDVGCALSNSALPEFLTGREFVRHFLELHDMEANNKAIEKYLKLIGVGKELFDKQIYHYDDVLKGHLQLLCLYILKPDIVLVEEEMDDAQKKEATILKKLLDELKKNSVVIISTSNKELLSEVCDEVVELRDGKLNSVNLNILTLED